MAIAVVVLIVAVSLGSCGRSNAKKEWAQPDAYVKWGDDQTSVGSSIAFSSVADTPDTWAKFVAVGPSPGESGTDRVERVSGPSDWVGEGDEPTSYSWDLLISTPIALSSTESWMILTQWHQEYRSCPPNVALRVSKPVVELSPILELVVRGGVLNKRTCKPQYSYSAKLGNVRVGERMRIDARFIWSADRKVAASVVCINGEKRAALINAPNLYRGMGAYLKQGIYRSRSEFREVVMMSPVEVNREALPRDEVVGFC